MNKQALKLKKKRRANKELEKQQNRDKIFNEFNEYRIANNLNPLEKTEKNLKLINEYTNNIDKKILERSGILVLLCGIYSLYYKYNYTDNEVIKYSKKIKHFIDSIAIGRWNVNNIIYEITNDYHVDIFKKCERLPKFYMNKVNSKNINLYLDKLTSGYFPYFLYVSVYAYMFVESNKDNFVWNTDSIEDFVNNNIVLYEQILNNDNFVNELHNELINNNNIVINLKTGDIIKLIKKEGN